MNPLQAAMYKQKKKRAVDPNAPPRPNLLSHEKVLKSVKSVAEQQQHDIEVLKRKVDELAHKLTNQTIYLQALHNSLRKR